MLQLKKVVQSGGSKPQTINTAAFLQRILKWVAYQMNHAVISGRVPQGCKRQLKKGSSVDW